MFAVATTLLFILTNSVIAQAAIPAEFAPREINSPALSTDQWQPRYSGTAELNGMAVTATLEMAERTVEVPEAMANQLNTLMVLEPASRTVTRLSLALQESPDLGAFYPLKNTLVSFDGVFRKAFVTMDSSNQEFHFVLTHEADGSVKVNYSRNAGGDLAASFVLRPIL